MKLEGLTVNFLGDSITEGCGVSSPDKCFHQLIMEKYKLAMAYNYGVGGTRIARQKAVSPYTRNDLTFEIRSQIMPDADLVVVFGGTNDYGHGDAAFGDPENINDADIYTFCGALNSLINNLERKYSTEKLVFLTPLHRLREDTSSDLTGKTLDEYAQAIRAICKARGVKLIDLFEINPLDPADETLVPDGLHPNDKGHEIMADIIARELEKM